MVGRYKALNTFIDDLFAFIIKMPTMHRLSCLRDDAIFLVYLYQVRPCHRARRSVTYPLTCLRTYLTPSPEVDVRRRQEACQRVWAGGDRRAATSSIAGSRRCGATGTLAADVT